MARWRLTHPHYLKVVGDQAAEWEYKEKDRKTGRQRRYSFPVPLYLDPNDDTQWTFRDNNDNGGIVVCQPGTGEAGDIEFEGPPTLEMMPLDDAAKVITAEWAHRWKTSPDQLEGSYGDSLADRFVEELSRIRAEGGGAGGNVKLEGMDQLLAAMTSMMQQNQQLLATLAQAKAPAERRV